MTVADAVPPFWRLCYRSDQDLRTLGKFMVQGTVPGSQYPSAQCRVRLGRYMLGRAAAGWRRGGRSLASRVVEPSRTRAYTHHAAPPTWPLLRSGVTTRATWSVVTRRSAGSLAVRCDRDSISPIDEAAGAGQIPEPRQLNSYIFGAPNAPTLLKVILTLLFFPHECHHMSHHARTFPSRNAAPTVLRSSCTNGTAPHLTRSTGAPGGPASSSSPANPALAATGCSLPRRHRSSMPFAEI